MTRARTSDHWPVSFRQEDDYASSDGFGLVSASLTTSSPTASFDHLPGKKRSNMRSQKLSKRCHWERTH